jgi:phage terminase large subunit-like protein
MSPAIKELEKAINNGSIYHGKNPVSRWQLGNVRIIEDHNENFKFSKSKSSGKIDGIVSMAMAIAGANITQEKKSPTVFIV